MKKVTFNISSFIFLAVIIFACSKENEQALQQNGNNNCDTSSISYSAHITPILKNECYACHSTTIANGGIVLDTYNGVKTVAANGKLVGSVSHASGYLQMPLGRSKLSDCNINKIKAWVNRGMVNN